MRTGRPRGPAAWTLLYDADCGFCTWIVAAILAWDRQGRLVARAIQGAQGEALLSDLDAEQRLESVHLVAPGGERHSAGASLAPLLRLLPGGRAPARLLDAMPRLTARGYGWVVEHRSGLSRFVPDGVKRRARERVERD